MSMETEELNKLVELINKYESFINIVVSPSSINWQNYNEPNQEEWPYNNFSDSYIEVLFKEAVLNEDKIWIK